MRVADRTSGGERITQRLHRPDYQVVVYMGILMLLGLVVMYAIGPQRATVLNSATGADVSGTYFAIKQFASLVLALLAFGVLAFVPLEWLRRHSGKVVVAGLAACGILFVFGNVFHVSAVAQCTLGACRWFELGALGSFQPAELLKFGLLLFTARFLADRIRLGTLNSWQDTIFPLLMVIGVSALIVVVIQRDMGTGISLLAIVSSMLFVAGVHRAIGLRLLIGILLIGVLLIISAPHRLERIATFFRGDEADTSSQSNNDDYHIRHAKIAIGSGGVFGVGIGNSVQATGYLPETINDSMFAVLGEMFGLIGLCVVLTTFSLLLFRILRIGDRLTDPWMQLIVIGTFGWLAAHVVLNVASMTGVFPLTGITLPLLSFGGTSMIFITAALGVVFKLSRYTIHGVRKEVVHADSYRGRGFGRSRHTSNRRSR